MLVSPEARVRQAGSIGSSLLALLIVVIGLIACIETPTPVDPDAVVSATHARLRAGEREDPRPIRLRSRDGIDLPLVRLEARGTVEDPLAFTELHMDFENPEPRPLDATLRVALPAQARVTRFAVLIEGSWREAEVVERKPGQLRPSLYEPALPWIDPEPSAMQRFEVLLPELPAHAVQKLVLSYAETFAGDEDVYRLALAGLREIPRFSARVVLHGQADPLLADFDHAPLELDGDLGKPLIDLVRFDWTPTDDLVVPTSGLRRTGVRNGRKVAARINPLTHDHASGIGGLTILFDTSASQAVGYAQRIDRLAGLIESLQPWTGAEIWLHLVAFDQGFETIYDGPIGKLERGAFERLRKRRALGASNLVSVLRHVSARRAPASALVDRVILISDGKATAGVQERSVMLDAGRELAEGGVRRIDVIADSGARDEWLIRNLVRQLPESGLVLNADEPPRALVRRLLRTVHDDVHVSVPGARWFYPEVVHGLQSDDEILVFADVETVDDSLRVVIDSHGKQTWDVPLIEVEEPLVDWALAQARVDFLVATLEDKSEGQSLIARQQLWRRIVTTSRESRVVNAYTRLAMLAVADDYDRARLDPAALPDVLFAGPDVVQRRVRGIPNALAQPEVPLAQSRLPRFSQDTLAGEQLLLLADDHRARTASDEDDDPSALDPDLELLVGELDEPRDLEEMLIEGSGRSRVEDPVEAELARLRRAQPFVKRGRARVQPPSRSPDDAYHGNLLAVMNLLDWGKLLEAKQVALAWRDAEPTEVMAVVALGEVLEANAEVEAAARAYGSIIDLHPDRADMRRFAGSRLEQLGSVGARLAVDTYRRAREQRPDHPSSHRLLAFALLRAGREAQAFDVLEAALERDWSNSFPGVEKVLREDLGLAAAAWIRSHPDARDAAQHRAEQAGATIEQEPSLRFVLTWETGANDVDLHVRDALGSHAYYDSRALRTGGVLYYDVTEGWGPEVFTILGEPTGYPYNLQVHYYARGPNGFGMGKLQIVEHDGAGRIEFEDRPFVVMKDRAYVDLGDLEGPLGKR